MEHLGRPVGLERHLAPVLAVADLGRWRIADQLGGRPYGDDLPLAEDSDAVGEVLCLVEVVRREQDRLAELPQRTQRLPGLAPRVRVEARGRLVEEDQLRVADEPEPKVETPPLAAREAAHENVPLVLQPDQLDDLVDRPRALVVAGEQAQALDDAQRLVHRRGLEDDADPLAPLAARVRRVDSQHLDLARVALAVALEDLDRGRLARAVRAEQAEDLAALDLEADPADRLELAVRLAEVSDADRGHGRRL